MKKKIAIILLVTILLTSCMAALGACVDEEPELRDVELELVNPTTGEAIKRHETIDLPEEKTPIEVRIKDKETGEYLTDDDLPENTVSRSCDLTFYIYKNEREEVDSWDPLGYWPTKEELKGCFGDDAYYYEIRISFDCKPKNIVDSKLKRKYYMQTDYICFYFNS